MACLQAGCLKDFVVRVARRGVGAVRARIVKLTTPEPPPKRLPTPEQMEALRAKFGKTNEPKRPPGKGKRRKGVPAA